MLEDFPINDETHPEMAYWVQPFVHYYYHYLSKVSPGGMIYINVTDWTVFSGLDKNLSARNSKFREMKMFLPYIQALLDISDLHARQLGAVEGGRTSLRRGKNLHTGARAVGGPGRRACSNPRVGSAKRNRCIPGSHQERAKPKESARTGGRDKKTFGGNTVAESTDGSDHAKPVAESQGFAQNKVTRRV
jgi:hypothetical protein